MRVLVLCTHNSARSQMAEGWLRHHAREAGLEADIHSAGFAHLEKMVGVKTFAEALEIQSAFVRKQAEMAVDQAKEMQSASQEAFTALSAPVKEATEKAMASVKAA